MDIRTGHVNDMINHLLKGVMQQLKTNGNEAFLEDKISNLTRTRLTAELLSTLVNLHNAKVSNYNDIIEKLAKWIISNQNTNGSWNETHANYNKPSSVFTAICALSLLDVKDYFPDFTFIHNEIFENAAKFLVEQEIDSGYFRKSEYYHADILNADAMVAAFLIRYSKKNNNQNFMDAGKRALSNVCAQQFPDGAYPYGGPARAYPYKYHLHVPCIHYQTVTLHYLLKSSQYVKLDWLEHSINSGIKWLLKNQNDDGYFNWNKSGLNFALYLTATYAICISLYRYFKDDSNRSEHMISKSIKILENQTVGNILLRWEKGSIKSIIRGILFAPTGGSIGGYPISHKLLRSLHRIHREIARTKVSDNIITSKLANRSTGYSAFLSTIESSTNYPDLYMTTEALEALSCTLVGGMVARK